MKLAVVVGGWHWPLDVFRKLTAAAPGADLFVIAHRDPELPIVRQEKRDILVAATGTLAEIDKALYSAFPAVADLRKLGWRYTEAENICGDWCFFNQWLERHAYQDYDVILNCHDDTYIRRLDLLSQLKGDWLLMANGKYPQAPEAYVRGSFEFWKRDMLDLLDGHIDLGDIQLTRKGKTDTPKELEALSTWNNTGVPLRDFMVRNGIADRISYLSPYYRISPWVIEGERGFMHLNSGAPWSFEAGLQAYPVEHAA